MTSCMRHRHKVKAGFTFAATIILYQFWPVQGLLHHVYATIFRETFTCKGIAAIYTYICMCAYFPS